MKTEEETSDMLFRMVTRNDMTRIQQIYDYYVRHTAVTFDYETPSVEEMTKIMQSIVSDYPYLVCEESGNVLGYAYARAISPRKAYQWSAETSIYLDPTRLGSGRGWQLYERLLQILSLQQVQKVYACITHPNPHSEHLHEAMGFSRLSLWRHTGYKFQSWYDILWMEKQIGNLPVPAPEMIPFPHLDPRTVKEILQKEVKHDI